MMKVIAFKCRPDEKVYFEAYEKEFNMEVTRVKKYLDLDTVSLTKGFQGVSVTGSCNVKAEVIDKLKENGVKFIASRSIGYDNIDVSHAVKLGIKVSNAEYSPYSVANYTVMMLLMLVRKSCYIVARTYSMDYSISDMQGREMQNLTIGVIGTGRIGQAVIKNLSGFGCRIIGYDPYPNEEIKRYMEYVELSRLYKESDVITLHVPYFQSNYHMINKESIEKMKDGVIILNAARGELIDTSDLIDGLESGKIGGAGIDCFENESGIIHKDHLCNIIKNRELAILKSFPNVIVTPHVAFFTDQAAEDMVRCSLNSLYIFNNNMENKYEIKR